MKAQGRMRNPRLNLAAVTVYAAARILGGWRWARITGDLVAKLDAARVIPATSRYHQTELAGLPAPVQRYFRAVLTGAQPIVIAVSGPRPAFSR